MPNITAKEIAAKLGISPSSVSLALNGKPGISERTRSLVLETAMQMGYRKQVPGTLAGTNRTICFIRYGGSVVNIAENSSFSSFVLEGIESRATELGYNTQVRYLNAGDMFNPQVLDLIAQADGIIFLGTDITEAQLPEIQQFLYTMDNIPVVVVDNFLLRSRVDCVGIDAYGGTKAATEFLINTNHTRIGYIKAKQRIHNFEDRKRGMEAALDKAGLPLFVSVDVDVSSEGAFRDFDRWLSGKPELPQAFFAENDILAAAAMRVLKKHGYHIPKDISVVGFDDIPMCEMLDPPLSTVHAFKEELGSAAVEHLHRRISRQEVPHRQGGTGLLCTTVSTVFVSRGSVKTPD